MSYFPPREYLEESKDLLPVEKNKTCLTLLEDMENCTYGYFLDIMHTKLKVCGVFFQQILPAQG